MQPTLEIEQILMLANQFGDFGRIAIQCREPGVLVLFPRRSPHFERHTPCGERIEVRAGGLDEGVERGLAFRRTAVLVNHPQRLALGGPGSVEIQRIRVVVGRLDAVVQGVDLCASVGIELGVFFDLLRADVRDIEESA